MRTIDADKLYDCLSDNFCGIELINLKDVLEMIDNASTVNAVVLPYPIGTEVYHIEPDGVLKGTIRKITVCGYSESKWQGRANSEKDHRFIIFHNSYNQPIACQLCDIYGTKEEALKALKGGA